MASKETIIKILRIAEQVSDSPEYRELYHGTDDVTREEVSVAMDLIRRNLIAGDCGPTFGEWAEIDRITIEGADYLKELTQGPCGKIRAHFTAKWPEWFWRGVVALITAFLVSDQLRSYVSGFILQFWHSAVN